MNSIFKPYRLINDMELATLQQSFDTALQGWNNLHAMFPLSCRLGLGPTKPANHDHCWAKAQPTCKTDNHDLSVIKQSLFGDQSDCFNTLAEALFMDLLNQLLGTQSPEPMDDWFYTGTPSLTLTLCCAGKTIALYLHPEWVLDALPLQTLSKKQLSTLDQALTTQPVNLNVELNPLSLKLADILRLSIGDVIKTDHPITEPAQLSHQNKSICNVEIGISNSYKSIQISRPS